jgi:hypothetical protein
MPTPTWKKVHSKAGLTLAAWEFIRSDSKEGYLLQELKTNCQILSQVSHKCKMDTAVFSGIFEEAIQIGTQTHAYAVTISSYQEEGTMEQNLRYTGFVDYDCDAFLQEE